MRSGTLALKCKLFLEKPTAFGGSSARTSCLPPSATDTMEILTLGIFAAALQATGYLVYGFKVLRKEILPNPASWLMFAYGTSFLLILEWDRDASFALLALPAACALLSIIIALYCLHKVRRAWWPEHGLEKFLGTQCFFWMCLRPMKERYDFMRKWV